MRDFLFLPVDPAPFPHALADGWLEPELYEALRSSFPECPPASGPTGYTYFWGDPAYDRLIADHPAWRTLFERFHSDRFVRYAIAQFEEVFRSECLFDLSRARYVPYQESRADKESPRLARVEHAPDELWVRMDIMQGQSGYDRGPHLDHRRRAATMLIYLCDAEENEMEGGDLILHGRAATDKLVIRPRHNRAAMFPCNNASWHSVSPIVKQARPRNFVQVTLSSSVDLWQPIRTGILDRARKRVSSLLPGRR